MKSLFFPIVFAFCFAIMLIVTKAVPTGETPSSVQSQNKACHCRPQFVRKSQCTLLIGILFPTLCWKQICYFPSCSYLISFALPKERKSRNGFRIHWSNPCRFKFCRPHQMKTKASDIRKYWSFISLIWNRNNRFLSRWTLFLCSFAFN